MKIITIPLSLLYRIIIYFRNKFYDIGITGQKEIICPVISVGNLSAGGTGKTPLTEFIADYFLETGKFIVIILKGYMREHDDMKVVELGYDNTIKHQLNTENVGDEAFLYLENLSNKKGRCLIVVSDNKLRAAKFASSKFKPEIIIVDDGFQHRKLARDLDIVIIDGNEGRWLIPAGKLREPIKNLLRADLLVLNEKFGQRIIPSKYETIAGAVCRYELNGFYNIKNEIVGIAGKRVLAFCGIGDPDSFKNMLNKVSTEAVNIMNFRDHHQYSANDINNILSEYRKRKADYIITSQKDFVRIKNSQAVINPESENLSGELLYNYPLYYAKIKMQITKNKEYLISRLDKISFRV